MPTPSRAGGLAALTALLLASPARAQAPGYSGPDARQLRAEFRAEMLGQVHEVLGRWADLWTDDDLDGLTEMYAEETVVYPPRDGPLRGRDEVRTWLASVLPEHAAADAFLQDFEASGSLAAVQTTYRITLADGSGRRLSGVLFTVFLQQGRDWRIRSQVFRPDPDGEAAPGTVPGGRP